MRDCDYEKEAETRGQEDGGDMLRWTTTRDRLGGQVEPVASNERVGRVVARFVLIDTDERRGRRCSRGGGPGKTRRWAQTRFLHSRMRLATPPPRRSLAGEENKPDVLLSGVCEASLTLSRRDFHQHNLFDMSNLTNKDYILAINNY